MWKWTDQNNIKAIILDGNSLDDEYFNFSYNQYIPGVNIFIVKEINNTRKLRYKYIKYYDIPSLLQELLEKSNIKSSSIISISKDNLFLKNMMQNHIGTILIGELKRVFLKNTPDFTNYSIEYLPDILLNNTPGYCAEVYATYGKPFKRMSLLRCESDIQFINGEIKKVNIYFGDRYYSYSHQYLIDDPLSFLVRKFKYQYVEAIDLFFDASISFIKGNEKVDILTYIPLKQEQITNNKFDRFSSLKLLKNERDGLILQNTLTCDRNFTQKENNSVLRKRNVKQAFHTIADVTDKNIIIIDDVYSTGSTILEAVKTLYESGANNVTAILLSVNQLTESSSISYKKLICPYCNGKMELKMNKTTNKLFFGCTNYQSHKDNNITLNVIEGIKFLKEENILIKENLKDLQDIY